MAKLPLTKLNLTKNNKIKIIDFNSQKIEVKQYLPVEDKINLINEILNCSVDEHNFYNPCKIHVYQIVNIIFAYTNISATEKQKEDTCKLYDLFISNGLYNQVSSVIPKEEIEFILNGSDEAIKAIYSYKNSAMGILENISSDYNKFEFDVQDLYGQLKDKENLEFINDILTKMG